MGIRTTVTLDEDVLERVKLESRTRGASFRDTLNDLLRLALANQRQSFKRTLRIKPKDMGLFPGLNYDDVESLIEYSEGPEHR
jgi:hypothetical protein